MQDKKRANNDIKTGSDKVLVSYHPVSQTLSQTHKKQIVRFTLNKPKALHALDLEMVESLLDAFARVRDDESVLAVFLDSEGDKAFCAGGDIVSMYKAMKDDDTSARKDVSGETPAFLKDFFTQEYRLDYCIHTFPKPVIVWGNGIIMGGGLGLFSGSHLKIVTESARIAMPEITIGLFPDVGGSYFLNTLPKGVGLFLGLTAANVNAADALAVNMADVCIAHAQKQAFLDELCQQSPESIANKERVKQFAMEFAQSIDGDPGDNVLLRPAKIHDFITELALLDAAQGPIEALASLKSIHQGLQDTNQSAGEYLAKAISGLTHGSPITAHLVFQQLKRAKGLSLAECFRMELGMALTCGALGEFQEGVRALLIDKDNQPDWQYKSMADVPNEIINAHFECLGEYTSNNALHPLSDLERDFGE
uniref:enoyl-CoA hydratase/isomerase family protein n=1 Tax=Ningiella ruwaisensis TaxID=2364274 RepID=UPI00109F4DDB|nr:enoyl-CoA hydratase/isomerase family protein [Ningiella ruwaisensis]